MKKFLKYKKYLYLKKTKKFLIIKLKLLIINFYEPIYFNSYL